jgi:ribose-phosphate pyrophosphokinase
VHAVFAGNAYEDLKAAGVARVVTTDTLPHETNAIEVAPLLAEGVRAIAASR